MEKRSKKVRERKAITGVKDGMAGLLAKGQEPRRAGCCYKLEKVRK